MATIYRRGRQWWGRVQRAGADLREPLKTTSRSVAQRRLREWLDQLDRVAWGDKPRRSFDEAMVKFIDEHLPALKPSSARRYLVSIENLTGSFEGAWLDQLGTARFLEFEGRRREEGAMPPTIRRDFAALSSMYGCCIDWEWLDLNPVPAFLRRRKKRGVLKESPPRTRYLSHEEERLLLAKASPRLTDGIAWAIDTGLRKEEQFSRRRAHLRPGRITVDGAGSKNSKPREVPLLPRAAQISAQLPYHLRTDFLWVNPQTGTRYRTLDRGLKAACKRAGIADVRWHDLRRTCGCRLLQDHGFSMEEVSRWLGHSSVTVTEKIYAFLEIDHLERALEASARRAAAKDKEGA